MLRFQYIFYHFEFSPSRIVTSYTRCMIIGDTKEVINKHYTKEDMNMKLQALNKFSQAMKAKSSEAAQELQPDGAAG